MILVVGLEMTNKVRRIFYCLVFFRCRYKNLYINSVWYFIFAKQYLHVKGASYIMNTTTTFFKRNYFWVHKVFWSLIYTLF